MKSYVLSPRAAEDLDDVWSFSLERWGVEQADRYIDQIRDCLERLAQMPGIGRKADEIRSGYRRFREGRHIIFYREMDGGIAVVRVLHERMDIDAHF